MCYEVNSQMAKISEEMAPAVFAVKRDYHIMMYSLAPCLMWVKVGDKVYYDEINGILRCHTMVHKVIVPMEELDSAKGYTLCLRYFADGKPYFPELKPVQERNFKFSPVTDNKTVRAYHIADVHNCPDGPLQVAKAYGDIDFLILNGDIADGLTEVEKYETIYELTSAITGGQIPVVFARGNHDMRGQYAEMYHEYTPTDRGNTYYTFRLGAIWGLILDCGEDKLDSHEQYREMICCHEFRERETAYIKEIIEKADEEYLAEGIEYRIVICHNPFTFRPQPIFDIEDEIYREWARLLGESIKPDVMITGHVHCLKVIRPGDEWDNRDQSFPVVIGAARGENDYYAGAALEFHEKEIHVIFNDNRGTVIMNETL